MHSLSDLESLSLICRSEQSKSYIKEAIACYNSGAPRAAIVSTWIAVVFDLIEKIRELALNGDAAAKKLEEKHKNYLIQIHQNNKQGIAKALEFEREILNYCHKELQFFNQQQLLDLNRLKEDRNRCAHPSFQEIGSPYTPFLEHARLHIVNAVKHVLSQAPVQGKAALALLTSLIASRSFPKDTEKALILLQEAGLDNAKESLIKQLANDLIFGFVQPGSLLFQNTSCIVALNAIFQVSPRIIEQCLKTNLNRLFIFADDDKFKLKLQLAISVEHGLQSLSTPSIHLIEQFIKVAPLDETSTAIGKLYNLPQLHCSILKKLQESPSSYFENLQSHSLLREPIKRIAYQRLSESRKWDTSNEIIKNMIIPYIDNYSKEDLSEIIKLPVTHRSDLLGAHYYSILIKIIKERNIFTKEEIRTLLEQNRAGDLID